MAKNESKRNGVTLVAIFALLILVILFTVLSYKAFRKYETLQKDIATAKNDYQRLINENEDLITTLEELDKQIAEVSNIETSIKTLKEETFKNIGILEKKIKNNESKKKIAYITFDDGPYYSSWKVLNTLDKYGLKATFFTTNVNGKYCYGTKGKQNCHILYAEYAKRNMTIANHTYSHAIHKGLYKSSDSFITAVQKQEKLISDLTGGYKTNIVRFPGGSGTAKAYGVKDGAIKKLKQIGYGWVDWTAQDGDGGSKLTTDKAWNNFKNSIDANIEVVLFHDYSGITIKLLPKFIEHLQSKGYLILPLFYESVMVNK